MIPSLESIKKFHGICFIRKGPLKGETIRFILNYTASSDEFTISESNFEPLNSLALNLKGKGNDLKNILVSISDYLSQAEGGKTLLKIATESETILKLN